jgi:putative CocE/NonD family hydrolase
MKWYNYLPLAELPLFKQDNLAPYFFDWLAHPEYDAYWQAWSVDQRYFQIKVPALHIGGWYDIFRDGTIQNFRGLQEQGADEMTRTNQKLLMGSWLHSPWVQYVGQMDFGETARSIVDEVQLRWFDYWLKGINNQIMAEPPVQIFQMGHNRWLREDQWPPTGIQFVDYYLHSQGRANSLNGDGRLDRRSPEEEPPDMYAYDPRLPVPSVGGHSCCSPALTPMGPADQREVEIDHQVLIYTTGLLEREVTVIGPVSATLWAASSAVDTDFTVKLVDVHPDGRALNVTEGIIRARYRDSKTEPSLLTPYQVYQFTIEVGNTCIVFKAGHRIRVEISSSNFPHWDRNTNSGNPIGTDSYPDMVVATQFIFHDSQRPSHLTLPVQIQGKVL